MTGSTFWFYAARVSVWFNKFAWSVYAFSEKLRTATLNIWMYPDGNHPR